MSAELEAIQALASMYETQTVTLSPESLAVLFYGLEAKKHAHEWLTEDETDLSPADEATIHEIVNRAFRELMIGATMDYPTQFLSLPPQWLPRNGYTFGWSAGGDLTIPFNVYGASSPFEIGSGIVVETFLDVGTYKLTVWGSVLPTGALVSWSIDGADFITDQDWYFPTPSISYYDNGEFVIGTPGRHVISARVTGKNELSSGYGYAFACISALKQP